MVTIAALTAATRTLLIIADLVVFGAWAALSFRQGRRASRQVATSPSPGRRGWNAHQAIGYLAIATGACLVLGLWLD